MLREFPDRIPDAPSANPARSTLAISLVIASVIIGIFAIFGRSETLPPPVRVDLASLEKQFDENPATGQAKFGSRPIEVRAVVSSIDTNSVELETIYMLTVTAEFAQPPVGVVRGPIVLDCTSVESVAIGGGYKPKLLGCSAQPQASSARQ